MRPADLPHGPRPADGRSLGRPPPLPGGQGRIFVAVAGLVIVGAQWGDEGKGKITDLLAERAEDVVRFQGGNNAGHTIVRDGEKSTSSISSPRELHPARCRDRQRGGHQSAVLTEELDRLKRRVHRPLASDSANAHLIMPHHLMLDQPARRGGRAPDRHHAARHRARVRRQGGTPGVRVQDLLDEKIFAQKIYAALEPKRQSRAFAKVPNLDLHTMTEDYRSSAIASSPTSLTPADRVGGRSTARRRASSRAPRARCSTSTTAPTPSSRRPTRWRAACSAEASDPRNRGRVGSGQGVRHPRGRGTLPHRAGGRPGRPPPRGRGRVRHHHGPRRDAAAGSTWRRSATPRG